MTLEQATNHPTSSGPRKRPRVELELDETEAALLQEALRLTDVPDAASVLRLALKELVERQRFLRWVALHEHR